MKPNMILNYLTKKCWFLVWIDRHMIQIVWLVNGKHSNIFGLIHKNPLSCYYPCILTVFFFSAIVYVEFTHVLFDIHCRINHNLNLNNVITAQVRSTCREYETLNCYFIKWKVISFEERGRRNTQIAVAHLFNGFLWYP